MKGYIEIFGKNEIVGQSYFKDVKSDELFVTSMFMTLQGEGPFRGMPAFFIRLAKCNLSCSWCDTFFDDGDWLTFDQIENRIERTIEKFYNDQDISRPAFTFSAPELIGAPTIKKKMVLVMTGGEPTLQANLGPFLKRMENIFRHTQIESNGILFRDLPENTTVVVSPKCSEKNGEAIRYMKPNKKMLERANCLKFVMCSDEGPYSSIPDWAHEWAEQSKKELYISPMNIYNSEPVRAKESRSEKNDITIQERSMVDEVISFWTPNLLNLEQVQSNHEYAAKYCITHGYIFNMQVHLFAGLA